MDKTLHYLGMPHAVTSEDYVGCPFTGLSLNFCKMMKKLGYKIIFYGVQGGTVECDEHVDIFTLDEMLKYYPNNNQHYYQYDHKGKGSTEFDLKCLPELKKRLPNNGTKQIVLGTWRANILNSGLPNMISIDPNVGHSCRSATYHVYPSRTWRTYSHARHNIMDINQMVNDAVIYNSFDLDLYKYNKNYQKSDYMLYLGRISHVKGIYLLMDIAEKIKRTFLISGMIAREEEQYFFDKLKTCKYSEYIGYANLNRKLGLLRGASCLVSYPIYTEPFGIVVSESQTVGTPVVVSNSGALAETVLHNKTGFLCSYEDDMIQGIENCKNINPEDCVKWGKSMFNCEDAALKYDEYFQRIYKKEHCTNNYWYESGYPNSKNLNYYGAYDA